MTLLGMVGDSSFEYRLNFPTVEKSQTEKLLIEEIVIISC